MSHSSTETNAMSALKLLLHLANVRVTSRGLQLALDQHPDFPSLNALSDVLNDLKVPNLGTRLTTERLPEVPIPALVHLDIEGGILVPIRKVSDSVEWYYTEWGWRSDPFDVFVKSWSGVALLIEPNEQSGECDYERKRRKEILDLFRIPSTVFAILIVLGLLLTGASSGISFISHIGFYSMGLIKLLGTFVSGLLVWYSLDTQNAFLQKVCQFHDKTNCQNILSSSAAKLSDWLSWAEVGLFYFSGGLLSWAAVLFSGNVYLVNALTVSLAILTMLALPYTIWSVYYQWKVAREWCILCLFVQTLLWAEFFLSSSKLGEITNIGALLTDTIILQVLLISFMAVPVIWMWIKPSFRKIIQYPSILKEFRRLKFDPNYLEGLLGKPRALPPLFEGMKIITFGNSDATNILIVVTNPTCTACRENHRALEDVIKNYDNLSVQIILAASPQEENIASKVACQILDMPAEEMALALTRWYEVGEKYHEEWSQQTKGDHFSEIGKKQLELHSLWLGLAGISSAPVSYLNAVELPKFYRPAEFPRLCAAFESLAVNQF